MIRPTETARPLKTISSFITKGATPTTYGYKWETSGVTFLRSECVSSRGLDLKQAMHISPEADATLARSRVRDGDILMTITGNVGRVVRLVDLGPANINQHIARIRISDPDFDSSFVYHYLSQPSVREPFERITTGQAYPQTSLAQVRAAVVPELPIAEQKRLSNALTDVDSLILTLEKIIAKKRAIKQGMMQELLTGRTRLPSFTGPWERLNVAKMSHLKARIGWQGLTTSEYRRSGEYRLVGGTEFRNGRVKWAATPYVDRWRFDQDRNIQLRPGDVLITKDGTIGKVAYVESLPGPATLNSGVFLVRPKSGTYDSGFLFHMLRSRYFDDFVAGLSAGSTSNHLYQRDLVKLELTVPTSRAEQRAIANALFDADADVESLERRLEVTHAIKRGMMQELFTGRTRLPVKEDAA